MTLLVQDDGQGFDPKAEWQGDRFGLRAITERARVLGATVDVDSLAGWGTRIRARFPYRRDEEQAAPRLRVLVAAARPLLRAGMARLLSGTEPGIEVVGEAATADRGPGGLPRPAARRGARRPRPARRCTGPRPAGTA